MIRIIRRIRMIIPMMKDKSIAVWKKGLVLIALIYTLLPVELVPDFFLPAGLLDDIILWCCITAVLGDTLDSLWMRRRKPKSDSRHKKYTGKTVIDDVEFSVKEEVEADDGKNEGTDKSGRNLG